jgi:hypothetical protein
MCTEIVSISIEMPFTVYEARLRGLNTELT